MREVKPLPIPRPRPLTCVDIVDETLPQVLLGEPVCGLPSTLQLPPAGAPGQEEEEQFLLTVSVTGPQEVLRHLDTPTFRTAQPRPQRPTQLGGLIVDWEHLGEEHEVREEVVTREEDVKNEEKRGSVSEDIE